MKLSASAAIPLLVLLASASRADAQQLVDTDQSVADRPHPEWDPIGLLVPGFVIYPSITSELHATDNYLATELNRKADAFVTIRPEVSVHSRWNRNSLNVRAYVEQQLHANVAHQNVTSGAVFLNGTYDVDHATQFLGRASAGRFVESQAGLGSFLGSFEPVQYDLFTGSAQLSHDFARMSVTGKARVERRNFHDVRGPNNTTLDQDFRDSTVYFIDGDVKYAVGADIGVIVSGHYDNWRYDLRPGSPQFIQGFTLDRDTSGYSLEGGITVQPNSLVWGSIQVGYLRRHYDDPRLQAFSGLTVDANVFWNVTRLTTLHGSATRSVQQSSSPFIAGNVRTEVDLGVDHELYRNVLLSGDLGYARFRANGPSPGGDEFTAGSGVRYLLNRRVTLGASLRHSRRYSNVAPLRYEATRATVKVQLAI